MTGAPRRIISTARSGHADVLRPDATSALEAWRGRVSANREQAERLREGAPPRDFYAVVASDFCADPRRTDEPALDLLRSIVRRGETWLDIGAGGGRYALPLALLTKAVIAVEPSESMRGVLQQGMREHAISNIEIVSARWPMEAAPTADVALMAHVGYDIADIGPFLDAVEASARRLCVAVLVTPSPPYPAEPFWPPIHGEARVALPSLIEFLVLLVARGRLFELRLCARAPLTHADRHGPLRWLYQQLFVAPDTEKGQHLMALARDAITSREGRWALSWQPASIGVVTWRPRHPAGHGDEPKDASLPIETD
jgi:SAM-dependent methyltransferase